MWNIHVTIYQIMQSIFVYEVGHFLVTIHLKIDL